MSEEAAGRHRLRRTFDAAADRYHRVRPDYPEQVFDDPAHPPGGIIRGQKRRHRTGGT